MELIFETAEQHPSLSNSELLRAVLDRCDQPDIRYLHHVFHDSLTESQRALLSSIALRQKLDAHAACEPLLGVGMIERDSPSPSYRFADPLLAAHLTPLRIHHISDVHAGPKAAGVTDVKDKGRIGEAVNEGFVRESYRRHVQALCERGEGPHLLIVSGDLAEHATKEQYAEIAPWIHQLEASLSDHPLLDAGAPRVLLTGGNHDVDWNQTMGKGPSARHRPFAEAFAGYLRPKLEDDPEGRALSVASYVDLGVEVLLLGSAELGGEVEEDPHRAALLLAMSRLPAIPTDAEREKAEELALEAARIDPGLVHARDLHRANHHRWALPVRIAVLHHPVSPLPSVEVTRYAGLVNAGAVKEVLIKNKFCLVLHGHVHKGWLAREEWLDAGRAGTLYIAAAPSLGSREVEEHQGYNEIEILRESRADGKRTHRVRVRRFGRKGSTWGEEAGAEMGPFEVRE
jgi:3',5'-cyclic AMP phosphodiesterase CpdA